MKLNDEFNENDKKQIKGKIVTGIPEFRPELKPDYSGKSLGSERFDAVMANANQAKESDDEFEI